MNPLHAAIYARVSSEQQTTAKTIASQLAALQARVAADGLTLSAELQFVDEGYSGATLVRPGLEQLRDLAAAGGLDRLYVHSPDRLARRYAYQVLLLEEFQRAGVEVIFLNRTPGETAEDALLLQVQGMVAEYERAKILERSRRGKRHAAHAGAVSVLSAAPYGYRYIGKAEGGGQARYEIVPEEARVVRQVFAWVGQERATIGEVCRRLTRAGEQTRTGKTVWDRTTVWGMLKNPAYQGAAAFGKTHAGPLAARLRAQRGRSLQPRRAVSTTDVPAEEWITIAVPPLVNAALFAAVQAQLQENLRHARQRQRGARYLLQGLAMCAECGYGFYGKAVSTGAAKGRPHAYAYYRCIGTDAYRFGGERVCTNTQVRTDRLDAAVWAEVRGLLEDPRRLADEYRRRLATPPPDTADRAATEAQLRKLRQGLARLIDSYAEGLIDKGEFEPRIGRLRQRIGVLEAQARELADAALLQSELHLVVDRLETFAVRVQDRLATADWATQRELIRALVKRVEIDHGQVTVVFRIDGDLETQHAARDGLPDRRKCADTALRGPRRGRCQRAVRQHPGRQPGFDRPADGRDGVELGEQGPVRDGVEAARDVRVQHVLGGEHGLLEDGFDGIVAGPPGAEAVAVRLEAGLPLRFERELDQGLVRPVEQDGDAQRAPLVGLAGLGDEDPPHRPRGDAGGVSQARDEAQPLPWPDGLDPVDARGLAPLVVLGDAPDGEHPRGAGLEEEPLEAVDCLGIATLLGSVDALLQAVHMPLQRAPGGLRPVFAARRRRARLRCSHATRAPTLYTTVPTSAYPAAFPPALASSAIPPAPAMRPVACSPSRPPMRAPAPVPPFRLSMLRRCRSVLYAEWLRVNGRDLKNRLAPPLVSLLDLADNARRPAHLDDASNARSSPDHGGCASGPCARCVRGGTPFGPLHPGG